jgi:hypothetical protein
LASSPVLPALPPVPILMNRQQSFYGWLGDVRVVDRPLRPDQFLNVR